MNKIRNEPVSVVPLANPFVGIVAVVVGTVLAVALVPEDHTPKGALFASSFCLAAGLLFAPGLSVLNAPIAAFRVEHLVMLGLVYWLLLDHLQGAYDMQDVGRPAVVLAFVAIGIFASAVWVAAWQPAWPLPSIAERSARIELGPQFLVSAAVVCASLTMFRFAFPSGFDVVLMVKSLAGNRWSAPWGRSNLGDWTSFIDHMQYFGYLLPTLIILLAHRVRRWTHPYVILSILVTLPCVVFIAHAGSRRVIGVMFGAAMICWVLLRGRRVNLGTLVSISVAGAILLFVMQMMLEFRGVGYGEMLNDDSQKEMDYHHLHVDDNFLRLAQIIEIVPDRHPFVHEKIFIWVAIRPIPRALWPGKPQDPGFDLTTATGNEGVSLSSSAIGELYLGFGWLTVVAGGWIYGRLSGTCSRFLLIGSGPAGLLMYATGTMAVFAGLRSMIELVLMSYVVLAWCGVVWLLKVFGFRPGMVRAEARG